MTLGWRAPSGLTCGCQLKLSGEQQRKMIFGALTRDSVTNEMVFDGAFELVPCRLHAAAPQMLEALEEVERYGSGYFGQTARVAFVRTCLDALAAARTPEPQEPEVTPLRRYGQHLDSCLYDPSTWNDGPTPCDCGLDEALAMLDPGTPSGPPDCPRCDGEGAIRRGRVCPVCTGTGVTS